MVEFTIISSGDERYVLDDSHDTLKNVFGFDPVFVSPTFCLYHYTSEVGAALVGLARRRGSGLNLLYGYWPNLNDREWRKENRIAKVA